MIVLLGIIDFIMVPVLGIVIDSEYCKKTITLEKKLLIRYLSFFLLNIPLSLLFAYMYQCLSTSPIDITSGSYTVCSVIGIIIIVYAYDAFKRFIDDMFDKMLFFHFDTHNKKK